MRRQENCCDRDALLALARKLNVQAKLIGLLKTLVGNKARIVTSSQILAVYEAVEKDYEAVAHSIREALGVDK